MVFEARYFGPQSSYAPGRTYDISPDGKRFLMIKGVGNGESSPTEFILVQNWFEELKRLVPVN